MEVYFEKNTADDYQIATDTIKYCRPCAIHKYFIEEIVDNRNRKGVEQVNVRK